MERHTILGLFTSLDPSIRAPIAISLGAIPGALSRYYLTLLSIRLWGIGFPYGTFIINVTGSLIMGFFVTWFVNRAIAAPDIRLLVAVGFLGSYTTFSTYALDTSNLLKTGDYFSTGLYWLGSAFLGVIGLELGKSLANRWS